MYADSTSTIHFRDPFSKDITYPLDSFSYAYSRPASSSHVQHSNFSRVLTPPPEMNGVSANHRPAQYQEQGRYYGNHGQQPVAPYSYGQTNSRAMSPSSRQSTIQPLGVPHIQQRKSSQSNAIAPALQIPPSVNDSQGSLSELAAQITCLFWFESSDILQQVEDSSIGALPNKHLTSDAVPTTGFRKWVTTILSTTQVAQNVIILALLFIYRLKKLNTNVRGKPGSEYRLLTVALMLGNKFLDDNTYTNKTWAEVSGINVAEVHIMEVEFLSNMKYTLFTSASEWAKWQSLLGKFAAFFDRSSRPQAPSMQILPPASSLQLPMALPSPPASTQASPPFAASQSYANGNYSGFYPGQHGPTPAPSPLAPLPEISQQNNRKRSQEDYSTEPAPKRQASTHYTPSSWHVGRLPASTQSEHAPRLTLPSLTIQSSQATGNTKTQPLSQMAPHLPPLNVPARSMGLVFPPTSSWQQMPPIAASAGPSCQPQSQIHSNFQSRQQSPYPGSAGASPVSAVLPKSTNALQPASQISPSNFLNQRNSPYRPVHNVSTLLYPPPSGALHHRPQAINQNEMHYQPLGKSVQERQSGRLPYIAQNQWADGNNYHAMTPVHQWPSFLHTHQHHLPPQQHVG